MTELVPHVLAVGWKPELAFSHTLSHKAFCIRGAFFQFSAYLCTAILAP